VIVGAVVVGLAVAETSVGRPVVVVVVVAVVEGASAAAVAVWARGQATLIVCPT